MVYISNGKIVKELINANNVDLIIQYLDIFVRLIKKYGNNSQSKKNYQIIKEIDSSIYDLYKLLVKYGKFNINDLNSILKMLKSGVKNKIGNFNIELYNSNKNSKIIEQLIKEKTSMNYTDLSIEVVDSKKVGINVKGDGYYFKRYAEEDIDKLL